MTKVGPDLGEIPASESFTWMLPLGAQLIKINLVDNFVTGNREMDIDGLNKITVEPSSVCCGCSYFDCIGISCLLCYIICHPGQEREENIQFKFENLRITLIVSRDDNDRTYRLKINGKHFVDYHSNYYLLYSVWNISVDGKEFRIVMDNETMNVCVNGTKVPDVAKKYGENGGAEAAFRLDVIDFRIERKSNLVSGPSCKLFVNNDDSIPSVMDMDREFRIYSLERMAQITQNFLSRHLE